MLIFRLPPLYARQIAQNRPRMPPLEISASTPLGSPSRTFAKDSIAAGPQSVQARDMKNTNTTDYKPPTTYQDVAALLHDAGCNQPDARAYLAFCDIEDLRALLLNAPGSPYLDPFGKIPDPPMRIACPQCGSTGTEGVNPTTHPMIARTSVMVRHCQKCDIFFVGDHLET
jgi:hypothetical protein